MKILRAVLAAAIILAAVPHAYAQSDPGDARGRRSAVHVRTTFGGYCGSTGQFFYGAPVIRLRPFNFSAEVLYPVVRPLGLAPGSQDYDNGFDWVARWPYVSTGGRDAAPSPMEKPRGASDTALREGKRLWRAGDPAGALEQFKKAVAADLTNAPAQLHMALALLAAGDGRHADRATRSALDAVRGPEDITGIELVAYFRNAKALTKFIERLDGVKDGAGSLTAALANHLLGRKERAAAQLAAMGDPAAAKLAGFLK
jgi:hypothetical protein